MLATCIGAAAAAFLCFNFVRPRAYLGDAGSLFVGLVLSGMALTIDAGFQPPDNFLAAIVIFAVPFMDTATPATLAVGVRQLTSRHHWRNRSPVASSGRGGLQSPRNRPAARNHQLICGRCGGHRRPHLEPGASFRSGGHIHGSEPRLSMVGEGAVQQARNIAAWSIRDAGRWRHLC